MASPELAGIMGAVAGGVSIGFVLLVSALVRFTVKKIKEIKEKNS